MEGARDNLKSLEVAGGGHVDGLLKKWEGDWRMILLMR